MKKLFILLVALSCLPVHAAWVSYQRSADTDDLYDNQFVSRNGARLKLWTLTSFSKPITTLEGKDYQSEKMLTTIDCAARKMGVEQVVRLTGQQAHGEVVSVMESPLRMVAVKAGSVDETLLERVCR
jgi:hypothetical protein